MALLLFSFLLAVLFTPLSVFCARRVGAIDLPDGERRCHARPTARLGGLALFFAVFAAALIFLPETPLRAACLSGGALLSVLGISDDIFSLSPKIKLIAEASVAFIPAAFSLYPRAFWLFGESVSVPSWAGVLFSVSFTVILSNAFNLVDGADMLCTLEGAVASLALLPYVPEALTLLGALLGFLPYNREALSLISFRKMPTRSFLGDTGALFVGYALSVFTLSMRDFPLFALFFFALPIYELTSSFFRRARKGKSPFLADRSHLHHRLRDKGYDTGFAVLLLFLYAALFASVGVLLIEVFSVAL